MHIFIISLGVTGGMIKTFLDLQLLFHNTVEIALRQTLVDVLIILAVVEVLKSILIYVKEGRVRVTFIIDTVLIVMLNEIMSNWFKHGSFNSTVLLLVVILILIVARIFAIKYSPGNQEE